MGDRGQADWFSGSQLRLHIINNVISYQPGPIKPGFGGGVSLGTLIYVFLIYRKVENQCGSAGGWHLLEQSEQHLSASASPRPPGRGARLPFSTASLSPPVLWFLERVSLSSTRCPVSLAVPPLHLPLGPGPQIPDLPLPSWSLTQTSGRLSVPDHPWLCSCQPLLPGVRACFPNPEPPAGVLLQTG